MLSPYFIDEKTEGGAERLNNTVKVTQGIPSQASGSRARALNLCLSVAWTSPEWDGQGRWLYAVWCPLSQGEAPSSQIQRRLLLLILGKLRSEQCKYFHIRCKLKWACRMRGERWCQVEWFSDGTTLSVGVRHEIRRRAIWWWGQALCSGVRTAT